MVQVSDVLPLLVQLFGPETESVALSSGFCQRRSKLSAPAFVQGITIGWLNNPDARLCDLTHAVDCSGASITTQALQQRFNARSAALLQSVVARAIQINLTGVGDG